jgi:short-subunit dehydrogenase
MIINVSSGAGLFTLPMASLYCASKFALEGFSEALSYELASQNIVVKIVEPHGGVTETNFSERADIEQGQDVSMSDYKAFAAQTSAAYARMTASRTIGSKEVANVIYAAATDGTDQLRYLVGNDSRGFLKARQEMPEAKYVAFMRSHFKKNGEAGKTKATRKK